MKCLQCGSSDVVSNVRAIDHSHGGGVLDLMLQVYRKPHAAIFKGAVSLPIKSNVCAKCGYVMLHVSTHDAQTIKKYQVRERHPLD